MQLIVCNQWISFNQYVMWTCFRETCAKLTYTWGEPRKYHYSDPSSSCPNWWWESSPVLPRSLKQWLDMEPRKQQWYHRWTDTTYLDAPVPLMQWHHSCTGTTVAIALQMNWHHSCTGSTAAHAIQFMFVIPFVYIYRTQFLHIPELAIPYHFIYCITPIFRVQEIFAIFANLDFAWNFPPAKIISTANGISRNFPPAKFSSPRK